MYYFFNLESVDKIKKNRKWILFFLYFPEDYGRRVSKSTNKKILALHKKVLHHGMVTLSL